MAVHWGSLSDALAQHVYQPLVVELSEVDTWFEYYNDRILARVRKGVGCYPIGLRSKHRTPFVQIAQCRSPTYQRASQFKGLLDLTGWLDKECGG